MRLSRIMRHVAAFSLAVCFVAPAIFCAPPVRAADRAEPASTKPKSNSDASTSANELVHQALKAEIDGDSQRRAAYLADALAADPENAAAHWHSGEIHSGDHWLSIDAATDATRKAGKVMEYRQQRQQTPNNATGNLALARWSAAAGLKNEERLHLVAAMQTRLTKKQASDVARRLGLVRYRGAMMQASDVELLKARTKETTDSAQHWKPRLVEIRRDLGSRDPDRCSKAVVAAVAAIPGQLATDALLRYAIFCEDADVRQAAALGLKSRPLFSYVPTLINALEMPVDVQFQTMFVNGEVRHRLVMHQEGPLAEHLLVSAGGERRDIDLVEHPRSGRPANLSVQVTPDQTIERDATQATVELAKNAQREEINERAMAALAIATGNDLTPTVKDWWSWWFSYNEMYEPPYKQQTTVVQDYNPGTIRVSYVSCFPAGTPVETSTGTLTIEQIKPGDCVLAQNPDSGELAYKPVMAVTLRPPSPLIEVRTEKDTIRATRGHPFWVAGIGWQMAKELQAGQWLHTVSGPVRIESADERGEAECHNLVVADFNSYFVGRDRILVHDNNLRQVTTATVPGLVNP